VSTVIEPFVNSVATDKMRRLQSIAVTLVDLGYRARAGARTMSEFLERRFAQFAAVPYQSPVSRQQWEELWETENES